jgi:steroid Delta-isomerase
VPGPDALRQTVERYVKLMNEGDADGIAELYADDASVEDPIGASPQRGRDSIRGWYRASAGKVRLELTGPIRVAGGEAAFPMLGTIGSEGDPSYLDIIDVMRFDDRGRIVSLRAFWSVDAIRKQ